MRVVVVLPLVPLMLMIGHRAGRRPGSRRADRRRRIADRAERPGQGSRAPAPAAGAAGRRVASCADRGPGPSSRSAASAMARARPSSRHGKATTQCPGSDVRWMVTGMRARPGEPARPSSTSQASAPGGDGASAPSPPGRRRHGARQTGRRARRAGPARACRAGAGRTSVRASTDRDLDLDGRLEAIHVGAIQQTDLDESHGGEDSVRVSSRCCGPITGVDGDPARLGAMDRPVTRAELDRLNAASMTAELPAYLADLQRLVDIDCGIYTKAGVDEVGRWVAEAFRGPERRRRDRRPTPTHGDTVVGILGAAATAGPALLMVGHMDTVFDAGTVAERPFRVDGWHRHRTGRVGHEGRPARGPVCAAHPPGAGRGCRSSASCSWPTPTRRSDRP